MSLSTSVVQGVKPPSTIARHYAAEWGYHMNKSAHDSSTGFPDDILLTLAGCKYPEISAFHIHSNYYIGVLAWWSGGLQYRTAVSYCSIVLQYRTASLINVTS